MDLRNFAAAMQQRGCVGEEKTFCGDANGYPFTIIYVNGRAGGTTNFVLQFVFAEKVSGQLAKALKGELKPLANLGAIDRNTPRLNLSLSVKDEASFGTTFDSIMTSVTATVRQFGYTVPELCPVCKQPGCDSYAQVAAGYVPVHAACVQQKSWQEQASANENIMSGSYPLGILGAVLGGIVGAIPTVLVIYFFNYIFGLLCALIPLGAYYGYKLLHGKMTGVALGVVIAVSALMAPVVNFFTELTFLLAEGYYITPLDYISYLVQYPGDLAPSILQNLLFIAIGVFIVSGVIRRGNSHVIKQAAFSTATLRPIAGSAPAAQQTSPPSMPQSQAPPTAQPAAPTQPAPPPPPGTAQVAPVAQAPTAAQAAPQVTPAPTAPQAAPRPAAPQAAPAPQAPPQPTTPQAAPAPQAPAAQPTAPAQPTAAQPQPTPPAPPQAVGAANAFQPVNPAPAQPEATPPAAPSTPPTGQ